MKIFISLSIFLATILALPMLTSQSRVLATVGNCTSSDEHPDLDLCTLPHPDTSKNTLVTTGLEFALRLLGAICLLIITLAGFRYVISRGDPQGMAKAKNTILYALIGLAVAVFAQALVTFVIRRIT